MRERWEHSHLPDFSPTETREAMLAPTTPIVDAQETFARMMGTHFNQPHAPMDSSLDSSKACRNQRHRAKSSAAEAPRVPGPTSHVDSPAHSRPGDTTGGCACKGKGSGCESSCDNDSAQAWRLGSPWPTLGSKVADAWPTPGRELVPFGANRDAVPPPSPEPGFKWGDFGIPRSALPVLEDGDAGNCSGERENLPGFREIVQHGFFTVRNTVAQLGFNFSAECGGTKHGQHAFISFLNSLCDERAEAKSPASCGWGEEVEYSTFRVKCCSGPCRPQKPSLCEECTYCNTSASFCQAGYQGGLRYCYCFKADDRCWCAAACNNPYFHFCAPC